MGQINKPKSVDDVWTTMSIMLYPTDIEKRRNWIKYSQHRNFLEESKQGAEPLNCRDDLGTNYWLDVSDCPTLNQINRETDARLKKGTLTGDVVLHTYQMMLCGIDEPSLRKAIYIVSSRPRKYKYNKKRVEHSEQEISQVFNQYRTVSHLWGALRIIDHYKFMSNPFEDLNSFSIFLSIAKTLQDFLTSYKPKRSRKPLVSINEIVKICANIPSGEFGFKVDKDFYEKKLDKYKSPSN